MKKEAKKLKLRLVHSEFRGVDETHLNKSYQVYASAGSRNSNQLNGCSASKKRGAHLSHLKFSKTEQRSTEKTEPSWPSLEPPLGLSANICKYNGFIATEECDLQTGLEKREIIMN